MPNSKKAQTSPKMMEAGQMKALAIIAATTIPTKISKAFADTLGRNNNLTNRFKKFWKEIQKEDQLRKDFTSELFERTATLSIPACPQTVITKESDSLFWDSVCVYEKAKPNPVTPYFDEDMWKWDCFKNITVPAVEEFESVIYRFKQILTHQQILDEAETKDIKDIQTYSGAKSAIREGILAGEVEVVGKGIVAYFRMSETGPLYRFDAWRRDDGRLNVYVSKVDLSIECDAGDGACLR